MMQPEPEAPSAASRLTLWWPIRLLAYLGALVLVVIGAKGLSLPLIPSAPSPLHEPLVTVRNLVQAAAMLGVYALLVRRLEGRAAGEIGLQDAARSLLPAALIGAGMIGLVYALLFAIGAARFHPGTGLDGLTVAILMPAVVGTLEELVFRAILFRILQHMSGTLAAAVVSASLFGLAHAANPGATPLAVAFLAVELGVFLALVYALTGSLWAVAGLHMGWNFAQGFLFGSDVSGLHERAALTITTLDGPAWLTGGAFGVEGSVVTLGVSVAAIAVVAVLVRRRGLWQPGRIVLRAEA